MLTSLYIKSLAVIDEVYMEFSQGMNVLTGETGAGKSILVDAIGMILGGRCSKEMVRGGANKATVIATFQGFPPAILQIANEYGIDLEEDELIIQRDIMQDGKTTARICGKPVTASMLRELGAQLVNIHGQHDNQVLLSPEKHLGILDSFGENDDVLEQYRAYYERLCKVEQELKQIQEEQAQKEQKLDLLQYQISEIKEADLEVGEDTELESDARAIKNAARITESLQEAHQSLSGLDEQLGAHQQVSVAVSSLDYAGQYYDDVAEVADRLRDLSYDLEAVCQEVSNHLNHLDFDPVKLSVIEERLDEIFKLKKKYGNSIEEIFSFLASCEEEMKRVEMYDVRMNELIVEQKRFTKLCDELSKSLTLKRKKAAQDFVDIVADELSFLNMKGVQLQVEILPCELGRNGAEKVVFLISTNVGEAPKSISKIASGGELSRIMLAIKNTLADKDAIPTLVFDEVDTGVSGSAAQKIGLKIKQAAKNRQVFCVTHLAQIAALADAHFLIEKSTRDGRTFTGVHSLDQAGRVDEVARIMSTGEITPLMKKTAEELLRNAVKSM